MRNDNALDIQTLGAGGLEFGTVLERRNNARVGATGGAAGRSYRAIMPRGDCLVTNQNGTPCVPLTNGTRHVLLLEQRGAVNNGQTGVRSPPAGGGVRRPTRQTCDHPTLTLGI